MCNNHENLAKQQVCCLNPTVICTQIKEKPYLGKLACDTPKFFLTINIVKIINDAFYWDEIFRKEYLDTGIAFVIGSKQFLDSEKEWFWEKKSLYLFSELNPNELEISVRKNEYNIELVKALNSSISKI